LTVNRLRAFLLIVVLLGFALRLYTLDRQSLWYDEGVTAAVSQLDLRALTRWTAEDIQPPLYYYVVALWGRLAGWSEWALRFPSACFGVLALPLLAAAARRLLRHQSHDREGVDGSLTLPALTEASRRTSVGAASAALAALLAALLAAVHPLLVYYSQEARMYTLLVALAILLAYLLLRLADRQGRSWGLWLAYVLAAAAAMYTHYFALFLLAGLGCAWLLDIFGRRGAEGARSSQRGADRGEQGGRSALWSLVAANAAVALLYLPWIAVMLAQLRTDRSYWLGDLKLHEALLDVLVRFTSGETMGERTALPLLLVYAAVTLAAGWGLWRGWPQTRRLLLYAGFWLVVPAAAVLLLALNVPKFNARYVMLALPALLLLWAGGLAALASVRVGRSPSGPSLGARKSASSRSQRAERGAGWRAAVLCLLLLLVGALWSNANWFFDRAFAKDNWRDLTAFLRDRVAPDEQIVLVSGHAWPVWDYYAPDLPVVRLPDLRILDVDAVLDFAGTQPSLAAAFADETGKRGAWLVNWQDEVVDPNDVVPVQLELGGREKGQSATFQGLGLRRYGGIRASRFAAAPPVTTVIDAPLGAGAGAAVILHGYSVLNNGDLLLFWQRPTPADPSGRAGGDLRLALQTTTLDGQPLAQPQDRRLAGYTDPTFRWPQGEIVMGRIPATDWLGPTPTGGVVQVTLRVYDAADPAAPLRTADGSGHLLLTPVEVVVD